LHLDLQLRKNPPKGGKKSSEVYPHLPQNPQLDVKLNEIHCCFEPYGNIKYVSEDIGHSIACTYQ